MPRKRNNNAEVVSSGEKQIQYVDKIKGGFFTFLKDDGEQEKIFFNNLICQIDSGHFLRSARSLLSGKGVMQYDAANIHLENCHSRVMKTFVSSLHNGMSFLQLLIFFHPGDRSAEERQKQEKNYKDFLIQCHEESYNMLLDYDRGTVRSGVYVDRFGRQGTVRKRISRSSKSGHRISYLDKGQMLKNLKESEFDQKKFDIDKIVEKVFSKRSVIWQILKILKEFKDNGNEELVEQNVNYNGFFCSVLTFAMLNYCEDIAIELVRLGAKYEENIKLTSFEEMNDFFKEKAMSMVYGKDDNKITTLRLATMLNMKGLIKCLSEFHTDMVRNEVGVKKLVEYPPIFDVSVIGLDKEVLKWVYRRYERESSKTLCEIFHTMMSEHTSIFFKNNPFEEADSQKVPYGNEEDTEAKIFQAVKSNDVEMVKSLLFEVDVNIRDVDIIEGKCHPNFFTRHPNFFTLLHYACIYKKKGKEGKCIEENDDFEERRVAIFEEILQHKPDIGLFGIFGSSCVTVEDMLRNNINSRNEDVKNFGKRLLLVYERYTTLRELPFFSEEEDLSEEERKPFTKLTNIAKDDVSKVVSDCQCGKSDL